MRIRQCFRYLFRREELSSDLDEEMAFHLEMRKQRQMDKGKLPAEAATEAHLRFGNITLLRERTRDAWRFTSLETAWRDIIQSLRSLTRTPVFTGVAIASLALGIGANAAIFSLIDRLLMATMPVEAPERLAVFDYLSPYPTYEWLRDHSPAFMGIAAVARISGVHEADNPRDAIEARLVTGNYFDVLKARPFMGRTIASEDDIRGAPNRVVVLSYPFWRARFQGDRDVIGRTLALRSGWLSGSHGTAGFENGAPGAASAANFTIIGVAGPGFAGETVGRYADIWVPMGTQEHFMPGRHWLARSSARWLHIIGRLKPGVAIQNAQTAENVSLGQFLVAQEGPRVTEARRELQRQHVTLLDGSRGFSFWTSEFSKPLWVLQAMVAVVLLLACVNLANLQMARAAARRREIATRLALGAGRFRLLRQLLFESVLLAFCGSVAAIPLAWYGGKFLFAMASRGEPGTGIDLRPDTYTLAFTAGLGLLVVLIFGLAPAVQAMNVDVHTGLKENGVRHFKQPDRLLSSKALAAIQVALATVLLVCTALFTRTLFNLKVQKLGYAPNRLILMHVDPTSAAIAAKP